MRQEFPWEMLGLSLPTGYHGAVYSRFPELTFEYFQYSTNDPGVLRAQRESGLRYPPTYPPDESNVTIIDTSQEAISRFASIGIEPIAFGSETQTFLALPTTHPHDPDDRLYGRLRRHMQWFAERTEGRPRIAVREGLLRSDNELDFPDDIVIRLHGDNSYLQVLAKQYGIDCVSAEPVDDTDLLIVQKMFPQLSIAVRTYVTMRLLPQAYHYLQSGGDHSCGTPGEARQYVLNHCRRRSEALGDKPAARLYLQPMDWGGGMDIVRIVQHLNKAHKIQTTPSSIASVPSEEVRDQIFSCTNSPVFQAEPESTEELCDIQKVAVLINRLRDRRAMGVLVGLTGQGISWIWQSGPLHIQAAQRGLERLAADNNLHRIAPLLGCIASEAAIG